MAGSRASTTPTGPRRNAIDRTPAPHLTARFAANLGRLWPEGGAHSARLGLAVSGGPDSMALLLLAATALPGRVEAATVDHRLRAESAAEADSVASLCAKLAVPHETLPVVVESGNLQDRARAARYAALANWCGDRGLGALATGHQLDDQAETLVMRLNRGSGLNGLAGVRARGVVPGTTLPLLRPLLGWRRSEIEALLASACLEPVRDPSNDDERFERVRVRAALEEAKWLDPLGLAHSAELLGEAEGYLAERIDAVCAERVHREGEYVRFVPGDSDFEGCEIARRIIAELGREPPRSEVAAMVARLRRGENASLGGVLVRVVNGAWRFEPEPPRRAR